MGRLVGILLACFLFVGCATTGSRLELINRQLDELFGEYNPHAELDEQYKIAREDCDKFLKWVEEGKDPKKFPWTFK